jgi:hypothetical protein
MLCTPSAIGSSAQTFKKLANFDGANRGVPIGGLVQGLDGNF